MKNVEIPRNIPTALLPTRFTLGYRAMGDLSPTPAVPSLYLTLCDKLPEPLPGHFPSLGGDKLTKH